jgi:glycosyltransferase involved in cell wall biosynthesis
MRIGLVGGIFGATADYRARTLSTPETVLLEGLTALGHEVDALAHRQLRSFEAYEIVHVHHFGRGAVAASLDRSRAKLVFTQHQSRQHSWARRVGVWHTMRSADAVVSLTAGLARVERNTYPVPSQHVVIPNGIKSGSLSFSQRYRPSRAEPWVILYAGQLVRFKRVDVLIRAVAGLRDRVSLRLKLAYHNPHQEVELRKLVDQLRLGDLVEFLGPLSQPKLALLQRSSHVVVLSSDSAEALPSVVSEAMMCGTPIVATDVGGVREQLGGFGLIVRPGDEASLARGLVEVFDNYETHAAQGQEMARSARERFSTEAMARAHERLYLELLGSEKPRRARGLWSYANALVRVGMSRWLPT